MADTELLPFTVRNMLQQEALTAETADTAEMLSPEPTKMSAHSLISVTRKNMLLKTAETVVTDAEAEKTVRTL